MKTLILIFMMMYISLNAQSSDMINTRSSGVIYLYGGDAGYTIINSEVTDYVDGLTTSLSDEHTERIDVFVTMLKDSLSISSLGDYFDFMYLMANETEEVAARNLIKRSHDLTQVNDVAFTVFEGFTGDGSADYLNTNYNPTSDKVNVAQNDVSYGIYSRTGRAASNSAYSGANDGVALMVNLFRATNTARFRLNSGADFSLIANTSSQGFFIGNRNASDDIDGYKNYTLSSQGTIASTGMPNLNMFLLAYNNSGTPLGYDAVQLSFAYLGEGLTDTEVRQITNSVEFYMDAIGAGVIPATP